ncbi:MAG: hypothetical protein ABIK73_00420 [candidate division WOR-3 bacterium]
MPYSLRLRGLDPELVRIVDDEYSDLFFELLLRSLKMPLIPTMRNTNQN